MARKASSRDASTTEGTVETGGALDDATIARIGAMRYEEAVDALEAIIDRIESGEIGLEESVGAYREGEAILAHCRTILESARAQVRHITPDQIETDGPDDDRA